MAPSRRRVSYVIPPPAEDIPLLQLPPLGVPRHGSVKPLLLPVQRPTNTQSENQPKRVQHPRHRLGIMALAVDTSTQLAGRGSPQGILYTGGRDGLVLSWDLQLGMKRREFRHGNGNGSRSSNTWESMTGMGDEIIDEEAEDEDRFRSDGDVLGDVKESYGRRKRRERSDEIPFEKQWEVDYDAHTSGTSAQFRQCAHAHTDWVNDVLLCNYNQTVVSASSDGTIKAWSPHEQPASAPSAIGSHLDYVRCLALCRQHNWAASGSFDRTIKLWDLSRSSATSSGPEPLLTLTPPDTTSPKSSIYAIAADPFGHVIASGSPERVIRMWDPRSGRRTGKLVGHTDNIRAILISEDSRYLLTGSTDASVKLWSLVSQRCLHTFTYHMDSVWSLFSSHPTLEQFYSGDKSGLVCKVDVENCTDVSEGACIVLCQETDDHGAPEGVNKIVAVDDSVIWTASGSSNVKRWKIPLRRSHRASYKSVDSDDFPVESSPSSKSRRRISGGTEISFFQGHMSTSPSVMQARRDRDDDWSPYGVPLDSLVRLTSPNDPFSPSPFLSRTRDPEVATLYSAASIMSVPAARSPFQAVFQQSSSPPRNNTLKVGDESTMSYTARNAYEERELAAEAVPYNNTPEDTIRGDHGLVRSIILNDRIHSLTVDTSGEVAVWDIVRGVCLGRFPREDVTNVSRCGSTSGTSNGERERSPREALEIVRERIEGEAVVTPWSSVDTKTGILTVHLNERCFEAEIYADEVGYGPDRHFNEEMRFNIGKWVLRNLFLGFIREEQRVRHIRDSNGHDQSTFHRGTAPTYIDLNGHSPSPDTPIPASHSELSEQIRSPFGGDVISSPTLIPAILPNLPSTDGPPPLHVPLIPLNVSKSDQPSLLTIQSTFEDATPMPRALRTQTLDSSAVSFALLPSSLPREGDYFSARARRPSVSSGGPSTPDDFSGWGGPGSTSKQTPGDVPATPVLATPSAGGLMGRLKNFGKSNRKATIDSIAGTSAPSTVTSELPATVQEVPETSATKTPLQILLSNPISPPSSSEAPTLNLPQDITLLISDEVYPGWRPVYRGNISHTWTDIFSLEETMPIWLLEYLLMNKAPPAPVSKLSFVLLPWPNPDPNGEQLPELLNTAQSKLTASRFLRVRKLTYHVQEKLDRLSGSPALAESPRSSLDTQASPSRGRAKAEDLFEIVCNDALLPMDMTLAAVRQFVWHQSSELVMYYRRKTLSDQANVSTI